MGSYHHLTRDERDKIATFRAAGHSKAAIAAALSRSRSTISRELRRNALDTGRYSAHTADGAYPRHTPPGYPGHPAHPCATG